MESKSLLSTTLMGLKFAFSGYRGNKIVSFQLLFGYIAWLEHVSANFLNM